MTVDYKGAIRLERREMHFLNKDTGFLVRLIAAVEKKDMEKVRRELKHLLKVHRILQDYHTRVDRALEELKSSLADDEAEAVRKLQDEKLSIEQQYLAGIDEEKKNVETLLARGVWSEDNWEEILRISRGLEDAAKKWLELDRKIVEFETKCYEKNDEAAHKVFRIIHGMINQPESIREGTPELIGALAEIDQNAAKRIAGKLKRPLRIMWLFSKASIETVLLILFLWFVESRISNMLEPSYRQRTIQKLEVALKDPRFIESWLASLTKDQQRMLIKAITTENRVFIEDELNKQLATYAEEIFTISMKAVYDDYERIYASMPESARKGKISENKVESDFLKALDRSRSEAIEDIREILRSYYAVDLLKEGLPGVLDVLRNIKEGDFSGVYEDMKWGALQPKDKIRLEDAIRKQVAGYLEAPMNRVKKELREIILAEGTWKQISTTLVQVIAEPSKASQLLGALAARLAKMGLGWMVSLSIICLSGGGFAIAGFAVYTRSCYRDWKKFIKAIAEKAQR